MTRQADPKATGYFSVKARNEVEHQLIGDLKRLACQDGLELADLIFEGIQHLFKAHHWPPGNPQTQLTPYQQTELSAVVEKCKCGRFAVIWAICLVTKEEHHFCQTCFSGVPLRFDAKVWKITKDQRKTTT
jgi:hypothetical protein